MPRSTTALSAALSRVRRHLPILLSVGFGVALSVTLFLAVGGWERTRLEAVFDHQAGVRAAAIHQRLTTSLEALAGAGAFYAASPRVDRQTFLALASRIIANHPELLVIEWAPRVSVSPSIATGQRADYFAVHNVAPLAGNERIIGFDLLSDPARWAAMDRAWQTGEAAVTGRVRLLQDSSDQSAGVQAFVPVYRLGAAHDTPAGRQDSLHGFVTAVFRVDDLAALGLVGQAPALVNFDLTDESAPADERLLYRHAAGLSRQRALSAGAPHPRPPFTWVTTFDVGGRVWSFHASPTRQFFAMHRMWLPWGVLGVGLLLTGWLVSTLFNALHRRAQVERQVAQRTQELTAAAIARARGEEALVASEVRYRRLFETAQDGILILDADTGRIADVNPFLVALLGRPQHELAGKQLWEIGLFKDAERSRAAFQALQEQGYIRYEDLPLETRDGRRIDVEFVSNVYPVGETRVIQCNIRDITARKRAEEALQLVHAELEHRVQERTAELSAANAYLHESYEQIRHLALHLQSIREDERTGIARELHDELGQALTALKIDLLWASGKLPTGSAVLLERIAAMVTLVDRMVETVQHVSSTLRPGILDDFGLLEAIRWQGVEFQQRMGIPCRTVIELEQLELDTNQGTSLFRILQEALTNVARHAHAGGVDVRLSASAGQLILEITDDGWGISTAQVDDAASLGVVGMRERALLLNGQLTVTGGTDGGTTVRIAMPYPAATAEAAT
jgi:PAS domain S-box-containing protein